MNTIICVRCKTEKPLSEFSPKKGSKSGYQLRCKECNSATTLEYYKKNNYKDKYAERAKKYCNLCRDAIATIKAKSGCCNCTENEPCCLDFHHLSKEEKDFEISKLVSAKNIDYLLEELPKCVIICSNCHRKLHCNKITLDNPPTVKLSFEEWKELVPSAPRPKQVWTEERLVKRRERQKTFQCENCGNKCSKNASRCLDCSQAAISSKRPTKEQLDKDFKELKSYSAVGRKYNVCDNSVRKWTKFYNK